MRQVRLGFSGFATPSLRQHFFKNTPDTQLLDAYGDRFGCYEMAWTADSKQVIAATQFSHTAPSDLHLLPQAISNPRPEWFDAMQPILRRSTSGPVFLPWPGKYTVRRHDELDAHLQQLWDHLPATGRVAVEFRDRSWFNADAMRLLEDHESALVWSTASGLVPYRTTADFLYLRIIGRQPRGDDEVAALLARIRSRAGDGRETFVVSALPNEAYGIRAMERFANGIGQPLVGPAPRHQSPIEDYVAAY